MQQRLNIWFRENLARGCDSAALKKSAVDAGYASDDVSAALSAARRVTGKAPSAPAFPTHVLALGLVFAACAFATYYLFFLMPPADNSVNVLNPADVVSIASGEKAGFPPVGFHVITPLSNYAFPVIGVIALGSIIYFLRRKPAPGKLRGPSARAR
jgi:hypothetical protein